MVKHPSTRGFTLIELVVVLTLVGLLVAIAAPRYFHVVDRGRESVQRQNIAVVRDAIDKFYGDLGHYPDTLDELVARRYLREVPMDPVSGGRDWTVVAPPDAAQGAVYDIRPPAGAASAAEAST
ncbi:MAG: prepilin-type N-terminal cleavage/methylation domain-containing protein [Rubrivivax sp.]